MSSISSSSIDHNAGLSDLVASWRAFNESGGMKVLVNVVNESAAYDSDDSDDEKLNSQLEEVGEKVCDQWVEFLKKMEDYYKRLNPEKIERFRKYVLENPDNINELQGEDCMFPTAVLVVADAVVVKPGFAEKVKMSKEYMATAIKVSNSFKELSNELSTTSPSGKQILEATDNLINAFEKHFVQMKIDNKKKLEKFVSRSQ